MKKPVTSWFQPQSQEKNMNTRTHANVGDEVMHHTGFGLYTSAIIEEVILTDKRPLYRLSDGSCVPSYRVSVVKGRITGGAVHL